MSNAEITNLEMALSERDAEIDRLRAMVEWLKSSTLAMRCAKTDPPASGVGVAVAGGLAYRMEDGWFTSYDNRQLNWTPKWWARIPQRNDPPPPRQESEE